MSAPRLSLALALVPLLTGCSDDASSASAGAPKSGAKATPTGQATPDGHQAQAANGDAAPKTVSMLPVRAVMLMPGGEPAAFGKFRVGAMFEGMEPKDVAWHDVQCNGDGSFSIAVPDWIHMRPGAIWFVFRPDGAGKSFQGFQVEREGPLQANEDGIYHLGELTAVARE